MGSRQQDRGWQRAPRNPRPVDQGRAEPIRDSALRRAEAGQDCLPAHARQVSVPIMKWFRFYHDARHGAIMEALRVIGLPHETQTPTVSRPPVGADHPKQVTRASGRGLLLGKGIGGVGQAR